MNFALAMFIALVVTGAIWLLDSLVLRARRESAVRRDMERLVPGTGGTEAARAELERTKGREPWWVEYSRSFFPVILVVFLLRSFLVEPFKIPSGSMIPTLLVGDFILVNKYTYGIRLPVINVKVLDVSAPQRGEVMVFRYPENPSLDYIKRVVGLPGDRISYRNKRLLLNGEAVRMDSDGEYTYVEAGMSYVSAQRFTEHLGGHRHAVLINPEAPAVQLQGVRQFPHRENCEYNDEGFTCTVPPGHYFLLGDNRDSSSDSRYWGFVPERNIVGKAFMIWWNFDKLSRVGQLID